MKDNIIVRCMEDDDFVFDRPFNHSCHQEFILNRDNIFRADGSDYEGDLLVQYYAICPNCGYMVLLDENLLSNEIKKESEKKNEDLLLYRKNYLISELIYLNSLTKNYYGMKRVKKI